MSTCRCGRTLNDCQGCKGGRATQPGGGRHTCSKCNSTGQVCSEHGGHWK